MENRKVKSKVLLTVVVLLMMPFIVYSKYVLTRSPSIDKPVSILPDIESDSRNYVRDIFRNNRDKEAYKIKEKNNVLWAQKNIAVSTITFNTKDKLPVQLVV